MNRIALEDKTIEKMTPFTQLMNSTVQRNYKRLILTILLSGIYRISVRALSILLASF